MFCTNLIPHTDFYKGYWYKSNSSNWYHFYSTTREFSNNTSEEFYETVDSQLVKLIKLLHSKGFTTTPSCSGHNYSTKHYTKLYREIQKEYKKINTSGLNLTNIETGTSTNFFDPNYIFPYTEKEFVNTMRTYGSTGVVGVMGNFSYISPVDGLTVKFDGYVTSFLTTKNNLNVWEYLYNEIYNIPKQ